MKYYKVTDRYGGVFYCEANFPLGCAATKAILMPGDDYEVTEVDEEEYTRECGNDE